MSAMRRGCGALLAERGACYAACLDFSVAKEGILTAYRWSGEKVLSPNNMVYVSAPILIGLLVGCQ
jgi:hypothetical protein